MSKGGQIRSVPPLRNNSYLRVKKWNFIIKAHAKTMKGEGKMKNILLVCGSGMSSGFMAKNIRMAAKDEGIEMRVNARSESEVVDYIEDIDMLLIGPHMRHLLSELEEEAEPYDVPVRVIEEEAYGKLDGHAVLQMIIGIIGK